MNFLLKYPKCLLSAAIVMFGLLMGIFFEDDLFGNFLGSLECLLVVVPVTLIFSLVALVAFLWKRRVGKVLSFGLVIGCSSIVSIIVFMETGSLLNRWKIDAVESYVARAVPVLDQIKQKEGAYPTNLPTELLGEPPELLRDDGYYAATQSTFRFEYVDEPAGWAGGDGALKFDSASRVWTNDDDGPPFSIKN